MNWRGVPTYEDHLNNMYYKRDNCTVKTYTTLDQYERIISITNSKRLTCEDVGKGRFNCSSVIESVWVRVWDIASHKNIIDNCGMQWYEEYQNVMSALLWFVNE